MNDLFQNVNGQIVPRDVCARKHGGNEQSTAAFQIASESLTNRQFEVLERIRSAQFGLTLDDLCVEMNVTPNAISGRLTELKMMGKIFKSGTRLTRSGCRAAIYHAK